MKEALLNVRTVLRYNTSGFEWNMDASIFMERMKSPGYTGHTVNKDIAASLDLV